MTTLSPASLQLLARSAGWSGMDVYRAVATALAESGGDPNQTSSNPDGGTNVGLFQLDTKGVGAGYTVAQLQDPLTNASVAWRGWHADGNTFKVHWETANNGRAAAEMVAASGGAATAADYAGQGGGTTWMSPLAKDFAAAGTGSSAPGSGLTGQLGKISEQLSTPAFWGRVGIVIIGGALVIVGLNAIAKPVTVPVIAGGKKTAAVAGKVAAKI